MIIFIVGPGLSQWGFFIDSIEMLDIGLCFCFNAPLLEVKNH